MNEQNHMTKVQEFKGQSEGPSLYNIQVLKCTIKSKNRNSMFTARYKVIGYFF